MTTYCCDRGCKTPLFNKNWCKHTYGCPSCGVMVCGRCAEDSNLRCDCDATLIADEIFGTHKRLDPSDLSSRTDRDRRLDLASRAKMDDRDRRLFARVEKRIRHSSMVSPIDFINDYLHRILTPENVLEIAKLLPENLVDELLELGRDVHAAHDENRSWEFRLCRRGLSNVFDTVDIDPGSDFALALTRLWLHNQN